MLRAVFPLEGKRFIVRRNVVSLPRASDCAAQDAQRRVKIRNN